MVDKLAGLERFWQELKRRKVFKVIAMYAGTAFIILEVINNLVSPLRLPEWTPTLVVVLLAIGFPFAIIFSWIFDITPEGIKKTDSIEQAKKYCQSAYKRRDMMPLLQKYYYKWLYARFFDTPNDEIIYLRQLMDFDDQLPFTYYEVGNGYSDLYNYEKAIPEYKKALEILDKWDSNPRWITNYTNLGLVYRKTNR